MEHNANKIKALKAVAEGHSYAEAAKLIGRSSSATRRCIATFCRELKIKNDLDYIRENKEDVLERIRCLDESPAFKLPKRLQRILLEGCGFETLHQLTPEVVSKISAARLLDSGLGLKSVMEIQRWLEAYNFSLRYEKPKSEKSRREVIEALELLRFYGFDVNDLIKAV